MDGQCDVALSLEDQNGYFSKEENIPRYNVSQIELKFDISNFQRKTR